MLQDKKLKSVAEAVAKIMGEDLKGKQHKIDANHNKKIDAEDFKILRGKKKVKEEVEQIDEVKLADLPARKISGKAYGGAAQKDEPEEDDDDMDDKPKKAVKKGTFKRRYNTKAYKESFTGMMTNLQEQGLGYVAELMVTEEPTNDEYTAEVKDAQEKSEGKGKKAEVAKPLVQAVKNEEVEQIDEISSGFDVGNTTGGQWKGKTSPSPYKNSNVAKSGIRKGMITKSAINRTKEEIKSRLNKEEVEQIEERTLSSKETKKKEEVVKSMKKKMGEFRKRYGSRGKEVMYATATKVAKGKK